MRSDDLRSWRSFSGSDLDIIRRALDYLSLAQLYLVDNVLLDETLLAEHIRDKPSGHWGVATGLNLVLAALHPMIREGQSGAWRLFVGAGHAVASARAYHWIGRQRPTCQDDVASHYRDLLLRAGDLGEEVGPQIDGHLHFGGQLGGAVGAACGNVLHDPGAVAFPIIGDGECETGATAASWLAVGTFAASDDSHGVVVPIVLLNGQRMGGPSLLAAMDDHEVAQYFRGMGWSARIVIEHRASVVRDAIVDAVDHSTGLNVRGNKHVVIVRTAKGYGAPSMVGDRPLLHTPAVHKTPLRDPRRRPDELSALSYWLRSYDPGHLLRRALPVALGPAPAGQTEIVGSKTPKSVESQGARITTHRAFEEAVVSALSSWGSNLTIFSPDELSSNRLEALRDRVNVYEVLNEELCHLWHQGHLLAGGAGLVVSYEAFAPLVVPWIRQWSKFALLDPDASGRPSMNYLITSLAWNNTYSHQDVSFYDAVLSAHHPRTSLLFPPDSSAVASALSTSLNSHGRLNIISASKFAVPRLFDYDVRALWERGWVEVSADSAVSALTLVATGDIATSYVFRARQELQAQGVSARLIVVGDLAKALDTERGLAHDLAGVAAIFVGSTHASVFDSLRRSCARSVAFGYLDPGAFIHGNALAVASGFSAESILRYGLELVSGG